MYELVMVQDVTTTRKLQRRSAIVLNSAEARGMLTHSDSASSVGFSLNVRSAIVIFMIRRWGERCLCQGS